MKKPVVNDLVWVWLDDKLNSLRCLRHFARFGICGKPVAFINGLNGNESSGMVAYWDNYEVAKETRID